MAVHPGTLTIGGTPISATTVISTLIYFSVATLTSTGMTDFLPLHPIARMLCSLEMIAGVLFIAVLIARLGAPIRQTGGSELIRAGVVRILAWF